MNGWEPNIEEERDVVSARSAGALHDLLERECSAPSDGDELPLLWHWLAFLPRSRQSGLGSDGHPTTGGFLPPMSDRKRMFAGARVVLSGALRVGEPLARTSRVADVRHRHGNTGDLVIVAVEHRLEADSGSVAEDDDLIYSAPAPYRPRPQDDRTGSATWTRTVPVDPALLFRFSALTYNAHRIHYDRDYATGVEGYPGLVVQGPLQAVLLADAVRRFDPGATVAKFSFRAVAPAFDDKPVELAAAVGVEPGTVELTASSAGRTTMTARAVLGGSRR